MAIFPRMPGGMRSADELFQAQDDEYARPDICGSVGDDIDPIISYEHHGTQVFVRASLQGRHRQHCLCWSGCAKFKPEQPDHCVQAKELFAFCVHYGMTTPVWECPDFEPTDNA